MAARIVIIGGGVIGSAVASFLGERGFGPAVTVIERDPTYKSASSALSASSIRAQFSTGINIAIWRESIAFLRNIAGEIGLVEPGYLYLASEAGRETLTRLHAVQRRCGAEVALLSPAELARRFPWLDTAGLALGSLGLAGEGWFDGYGLLQWFRRRARAAGVRYVADEAIGMSRRGRRIVCARLAGGDEIECDFVVNAAGPWAGEVAALAEADLPVRPRRRTVFVIDCRKRPPEFPLVIDPSGVWFRPEGAQTICGVSPDATNDPDHAPLEVEYPLFDEIVWPALAKRVPAFAAIRLTSAWAGYYDFNTFDQNGIVGPHAELDNLILANGFSGHGMQQAPTIGRGVAEWIACGRYVTLDLGALGHDRIGADRPLREANVI